MKRMMNDLYKQRGGNIIDKFNLDCINQISKNMPDNSIICDIGGYRAEFTVFCLELLDNNKIKQIQVFEPDKSNYKKIVNIVGQHPIIKTTNKGIFYGATSCVAQGVGDYSDAGYMVEFIDDDHKKEFAQTLHNYEENVFSLTTLEECISNEYPLFLAKIDVEASEYNIIENSTIIHDFDYLIIEWHNHDHDRQFVYDFIEKNLSGHTIINDDGRHTLLGKNKFIETTKEDE